ncbi:MAG: CopG family transcriptional regulator [Puniceicoccaceae bacterium]|nr:CopG family transcriptional regulator [Puniceicoccaceae bacterium]|tara:strand:- start:661 stop:882 length:222 start_codon:yes stop_codon:yes gene_type:complete
MKRATVYFEEDLHKALKMKSAEVSSPVSELVNDAVRAALLEDAEDLEAFKEREKEPVIDFEAFVASLKDHGKL